MKSNNTFPNIETFTEFLKLQNAACRQKYLGTVNRKRLKRLAKKHIPDVLSIEAARNLTKSKLDEMVNNLYTNLTK